MAYYDMALPIGDQQTISSPFIVAYMTECLDPQPTDRVLEIGTGSGFQAAVLSPLVKDVYTIEIVESLGRKAARVLDRLNYDNVHPLIGDGFKGWPEHAPFDKIVVTCSPEKVPLPLVEQLKEGGLMVIPVGERYQQTMYLMRKVDGKLEKEVLRPTLFVPMTGTAENQREVAPDPANPQVVNGSFEEDVDEDGFVPGWYYQRQAECVKSDDSPVGEHYVRFNNSDAGRGSRLLQGMGIDGRVVHEIELSAWVSTSNVVPGPEQSMPRVLISFYDDQRADLGQAWLGPWRGTVAWRKESRKVRVPARAREAIIRVGLLGATGEAAFDDIRISKPSSIER
jgi:protein-L-isoaspartate(D-aspartate) O-methyltransferase